ncbi:hypothetical protein WG66_011372 [Moniliophthora roreri]|nr:hypothetical protein WG66_011372 [Moniliophthora roreri]
MRHSISLSNLSLRPSQRVLFIRNTTGHSKLMFVRTNETGSGSVCHSVPIRAL